MSIGISTSVSIRTSTSAGTCTTSTSIGILVVVPVLVLIFVSGRVASCSSLTKLFEFRAYWTSDDGVADVRTFHMHVCSGTARTPLLPFRLNFIGCQRVEGEENMFQYSRRIKVTEARRLPFCRSAVPEGMLDHYDLEELTDTLVKRDDADDSFQLAEVQIETLDYEEVPDDKFLVVGEAAVYERALADIADDDGKADDDSHQDGDAVGDKDSDEEWGGGLLPSAKAKPLRRDAGKRRGEPADGGRMDDLDTAGVLEDLDHLGEDLMQILGEESKDMLAEAQLLEEDTEQDDDLEEDEEHMFGDESDQEEEHEQDRPVFSEDVVLGTEALAPEPSSSRAPEPEPEPVTARNCLTTLQHVKRAADLGASLPDYEISNFRWETKIVSTGEVLGKVRMIQGNSLRADCRRHGCSGGSGIKCKMHCDLKGRWEELDALMGKWLVSGAAMTAEEHMDSAQRLMHAWRTGEPV